MRITWIFFADAGLNMIIKKIKERIGSGIMK